MIHKQSSRRIHLPLALLADPRDKGMPSLLLCNSVQPQTDKCGPVTLVHPPLPLHGGEKLGCHVIHSVFLGFQEVIIKETVVDRLRN